MPKTNNEESSEKRRFKKYLKKIHKSDLEIMKILKSME